MKILIAPDKMKGSISARDICDIVEKEIHNYDRNIDVVKCPIADGGDGTLAVIQNQKELAIVNLVVEDPIGRDIEAYYCVHENEAYIELPIASGLALLSQSDYNPMHTSTYGTGQLLRHAIINGCTTVYLMLGGSSTNEVGIGILSALGYNFLDENENLLEPIGKNLIKIITIDDSHVLDLSTIDIKILCDVTNPLYGPNGAAHVFGKQKGADVQEREYLDQGAQSFALVVKQFNGINIGSFSGAGAAGGIAAGLFGLCNAEILPGFQTIADMVGLRQKVLSCDIVISGEGRLDNSSFEGKVVGGIYRLCDEYNKPLFLIVGDNICSQDILSEKGIKIATVSSLALDLEDAQKNVVRYLKQITENLLKGIIS